MVTQAENQNTFIQLITYDSLLNDIKDDLGGTVTKRTGWKTEMINNIAVQIPTYETTRRPSVQPTINAEGVDKIMTLLREQISKVTAIGYLPVDQKAFKVVRLIDTINSDITLNSAYYGIGDYAAWRSSVGKIREFLDSFFNAVVNGGIRGFGEDVLSINTQENMIREFEPQQSGGLFGQKPRQAPGPQNPLY